MYFVQNVMSEDCQAGYHASRQVLFNREQFLCLPASKGNNTLLLTERIIDRGTNSFHTFIPIKMGGKTENVRVASPEVVPIHLKMNQFPREVTLIHGIFLCGAFLKKRITPFCLRAAC